MEKRKSQENLEYREYEGRVGYSLQKERQYAYYSNEIEHSSNCMDHIPTKRPVV